MKVGILTFHNAHNYGAVLQAYALKKTILKMGHDVSIINYRNDILEKRYSKDLKCSLNFSDLVHPKQLINKSIFISELSYKRPSWEKQYDRFKEFENEYLLDNRQEKVTIKEIQNSKYDALIVGSDQVWESNITGGLDDVYYLNFELQGVRKISYAASLGNYSMPDENKIKIKEYLGKFDYLSVREKKLKTFLEDLVGKPIYECLDPTLLLDKNDYIDICGTEEKSNDKYVFAYFVVEDAAMAKLAWELAKKNNCKLIELHYYMQKKYKDHNQFADFSPIQFLEHIKNAEYVVTNSFHGTVFSIIFNTRFYSFYKENTRIENLLDKTELTKCHVDASSNLLEMEYDFELANERLKEYRKDSLDYLNMALKVE